VGSSPALSDFHNESLVSFDSLKGILYKNETHSAPQSFTLRGSPRGPDLGAPYSGNNNGADRIRIGTFLRDKQGLYQLSYCS
jgi:hypothetical protein